MGGIIEINDYLSVETRRASFAIIADDAFCNQNSDGHGGSMELDYRNVYPLIAALEQIEAHPRFRAWLAKKEPD